MRSIQTSKVDKDHPRDYYWTVSPIQHVLIIIDDVPALEKAAEAIAKKMGDARTVVRKAADFSPVDILPADACFLGCDSDHPTSFSEVERVLKGINLAGRPCGLFTLASRDAMEYLRSIVRDSELRTNPTGFMVDGQSGIGPWALETLQQR